MFIAYRLSMYLLIPSCLRTITASERTTAAPERINMRRRKSRKLIDMNSVDTKIRIPNTDKMYKHSKTERITTGITLTRMNIMRKLISV